MADITGDNNNNNITGTAGADRLDGKGGNDTVTGGDGNDTIKGGSENDSLSGGLGNDQIDGESGSNTIFGDEGDDNIKGGTGNDTISGGSGFDTIDGEGGFDRISGGDGNDSIKGGSQDDTIWGGSGDDTLLGEADNDKLSGETGNDSISGGGGNDTLYGGTGNDTLTGGSGADTFVYRDGDGNDTITDLSEQDVIAFDMAEIQNFSDVQARMMQDGADTVITFDSGETITLQGVTFANVSASNFQYNAGPVCLLAGTEVDTANGPRAVESLRPGDLIVTLDAGLRPLRALAVQRLRFRSRNDPAKPILIPTGALGPMRPARDLIVSPQHRVMIGGADKALVPARALETLPGVRRMRGRKVAVYVNLLFDRHHVIIAEGACVESLLATPNILPSLPPQVRSIAGRLCPMQPALPVLRTKAAARRLIGIKEPFRVG